MSEVTVNEATAIVARAELADAVAFAAKALPKRPVVPVLAGMWVRLADGRVTFGTFDYEVSARSAARAETEGSAGVLVRGHELADAVKALPKSKTAAVLLTVNAAGVAIECDGTQLTVAGMGADAQKEYPALPVMPAARGVAESAVFTRSALRAAACAGTDGTLPVLMCVRFEFGAGLLTMAATDRYRLAVDEMPWTSLDGEAGTALVDAKALVMFAKGCDKNGKVYICASDGTPDVRGISGMPGRIGFTDGMREMVVTQQRGEFPKYRKFGIDRNAAFTTEITADGAKLAATVARLGKLAERNTPVTLAVTQAGITLSVTRDGQAAASETFAAQVDGAEITAAFNPGYLASVLAGVGGTAQIGIVSPLKPATVRSADGYTAIVMPIKIQA